MLREHVAIEGGFAACSSGIYRKCESARARTAHLLREHGPLANRELDRAAQWRRRETKRCVPRPRTRRIRSFYQGHAQRAGFKLLTHQRGLPAFVSIGRPMRAE